MAKDIFFKTLMLKGEAGGTITSIDKLEAEGGSWIMRVTLSDGSEVDFPVNDAPDAELIKSVIDEALKVIKTTVSSSGWSNTAPYTYTIEAEGVTSLDDYEIIGFIPTNDPATNQSIRDALALITYGTTGTDEITLVATVEKPTVNIPLVLRRVGTNGLNI